MARPRLEVADVFRAHGAAWRKANAGHVSLAQLKVMSAIETCRTAALGGLWAGLVEWCEEQRDSMVRQNEMMGSGKMRVSSSDGPRIVDETPRWIEENTRRIAELEELLSDVAAGKF